MKFGKFFAILSAAGLMLFFTLDAGADGWGIRFNSHGYRGGDGWGEGVGGDGDTGAWKALEPSPLLHALLKYLSALRLWRELRKGSRG